MPTAPGRLDAEVSDLSGYAKEANEHKERRRIYLHIKKLAVAGIKPLWIRLIQ